jgi:hypothetical protein
MSRLSDPLSARKMNTLIGLLEIKSSQAFTFYDTMFDLLTQRNSKLGIIIPGCERIASDALRRNHPLLRTLMAPVVYFNRGYGAAVLREGVPLPYGIKNPLSLMQMPYSKFVSLSTFTSIAHESGHIAQDKLQLERTFQRVLREALLNADASRVVTDILSNAHTEIFADLWGMCLCGSAYLSVSRDLLSVPPTLALAVNSNDPHPTPLVRMLLLFRLARELWGSGIWQRWEKEVLNTYPVDVLQKSKRYIIEEQIRLLPDVTSAISETTLKELGGRPITSLFDLRAISIQNFENRIYLDGKVVLTGLSPCQGLSLFRYLFDKGLVREEVLDRLIVQWLLCLAAGKELTQVRLLK